MKTPKLLIFLFAFVMGFCTFCSTPTSAQSTEKIRIYFATRTHSTGSACDGDKGICIIITVSSIIQPNDNAGQAEIYIANNKMFFNILEDSSPADVSENYFYLYEDKSLDKASAEKLGYTSVLLKKGRYPLNKSKNKFGSTELNVETQ